VSAVVTFLTYSQVLTIQISKHRQKNKECLLFNHFSGRSQWLRSLRRGPAASPLVGLRIPIPPGAWMSVSCQSCVLSCRGNCVGLITRPGESYRMWRIWMWSWSFDMRRTWPAKGLLHYGEKNITSEEREVLYKSLLE